MRALLPLLAASLVLLVLSLSSADAHSLRVECATPHTLRLYRFEDGSARLECGARTLVRISVPG
jgi:hypothetical protein